MIWVFSDICMCGVKLKGSDGTKLEGQVQLHDAAPKFACDELYIGQHTHTQKHTYTSAVFRLRFQQCWKVSFKVESNGQLAVIKRLGQQTLHDPAEDKHGICLPVV